MSSQLDLVTIRGFKSIQNLSDFELRDVNVFVGPNGAGKSNFISFFKLLQHLMDDNLAGYVRSAGGINDLLHNGPKHTDQMDFEMHFGLRGYRFCIENGPGENYFLINEARFYEKGSTGWWQLDDSTNNKSKLVDEIKRGIPDARFSKPVYDAIRSWVIYHFHDTSTNSGMRQAEIIQDNKVFRGDGSNIAPFLLRLRENHFQHYSKILEICKMVIPSLDEFLLDIIEDGPKKKVALSWRTKNSDYPMQPYHLSDGSIRFICLATALLQPHPPSSIIIDEPELGLHPVAMEILADLIETARSSTQLIIGTQSPQLLDYLSVEDIVVVNHGENGSNFIRLNADDYTEWLETYSVGQLWTKNVIDGGF